MIKDRTAQRGSVAITQRKIYLVGRFIITLLAIVSFSSPVAASQATPENEAGFERDPESINFPVFGNAFDLLDAGEAGQLSIVAIQQPDGEADSLAFVIKNNTDQTLRPQISAIARDSAGNLIGTGEASSPNSIPFVAEPGGFAIGEIRFDSMVPAEADLELKVMGGEDQYTVDEWRGLTLSEFNAEQGIGIVTNETDVDLDTFWSYIACFEGGELKSLEIASIASTSLVAGDYSPMEILFFGDKSCETFIYAGLGTK